MAEANNQTPRFVITEDASNPFGRVTVTRTEDGATVQVQNTTEAALFMKQIAEGAEGKLPLPEAA